MKWEKVAIKSVCKGIYDGPHATPPVSDTGAIFLGISNFSIEIDLFQKMICQDGQSGSLRRRVISFFHMRQH